jgi:hypothetical protein
MRGAVITIIATIMIASSFAGRPSLFTPAWISFNNFEIRRGQNAKGIVIATIPFLFLNVFALASRTWATY